jgi:predicted flap endonuclease-1-like 5' DNA nuclease
VIKLSQLETIGVKFSELLTQFGIEDQETLLKVCSHRQGREALSNETGINLKLIIKWTTYADLSRIIGIGEDYAELLEHGNIQSVQHLAGANPEKLYDELLKINSQMGLVRQLPSVHQVTSWIEQAKKLPELLE